MEFFMISKNKALEFVSKHLKNKNLIKHCLASEAVMRALAKHFGENEEEWGLAGLLHDADVEIMEGETITGLIVASTLVLKDKKISSLTKESVIKRFHEKRFAAGANRNLIMHCEKIGLSLDQFSEICLTAMQNIANDLEL